MAVDLRPPAGQRAVTRLITEAAGGGILLTNVAGRDWQGYDTLAALRPDLIQLEVYRPRRRLHRGRLHRQRRRGLPAL